MRKALSTLLRVRSAHKRIAERDFGEAERARFEQEAMIDGLQQAMLDSHSSDEEGCHEGEATWLALEHGYRLRLEVRIRRENGVLLERSQVSAACRDRLVEADRAARVVEIALEKHDEQVAIEERRADGRRMDALAGARWWRGRTA